MVKKLLFIYFLSYSIYLHVVTEIKVYMLKQTFKSLQGPLGVPGPQFPYTTPCALEAMQSGGKH